MDSGAVDVVQHREGRVHLRGCRLPELRTGALRARGGSLFITESTFTALSDGAITAEVATFHFNRNIVLREMGRLNILSSEMMFTENHFLGEATMPFEWGRFVQR